MGWTSTMTVPTRKKNINVMINTCKNQYSTLPSINKHHFSLFSSSSWVSSSWVSSSWVSSSWELALHALREWIWILLSTNINVRFSQRSDVTWPLHIQWIVYYKQSHCSNTATFVDKHQSLLRRILFPLTAEDHVKWWWLCISWCPS